MFHLVGFFYVSYTIMHGSTNIKLSPTYFELTSSSSVGYFCTHHIVFYNEFKGYLAANNSSHIALAARHPIDAK
jgi:hypothetical protein